MGMIQRPTAAGLVLCQFVIVEEKTRNITLANSFQRIEAEDFPSVPFPFFAYAVLTDGLGDVTLELAVSRCDTLEPIYARAMTTSMSDPLRQLRLYWQVRSCSFPAPGRYEFSLQADGEVITQTILKMVSKGDSHE